MYKLNENYFKFIDSHEKAYWLGFISADECIHVIYLSRWNITSLAALPSWPWNPATFIVLPM